MHLNWLGFLGGALSGSLPNPELSASAILATRSNIRHWDETLRLWQRTATTVGAAGAATALPANPLGYKIEYIDGVGLVKTPYYNT